MLEEGRPLALSSLLNRTAPYRQWLLAAATRDQQKWFPSVPNRFISAATGMNYMYACSSDFCVDTLFYRDAQITARVAQGKTRLDTFCASTAAMTAMCNYWTTVSRQDYSGLVISEIMYNPPLDALNISLGPEYVELYNNGSVAVNLHDCFFSESINYVIANVTINPGEFAVICADVALYQSAYPTNPPCIPHVYAGWKRKLRNSGGLIRLNDPWGRQIISLPYFDNCNIRVRFVLRFIALTPFAQRLGRK